MAKRATGGATGGALLRLATAAVVAVLAGALSYRVLAQAATTPTSSGGAFLSALKAAGLVTNAGDLSISEHCQQDHAAELAEQMVALAPEGWSNCHDSEWLAKLEEISDPALDRTFVDIGCNKGYTSAAFFALFAPGLGFNPPSLYEKTGRKDCGSCGDCHEKWVPAHQPPAGQQPAVQVLCVEPNLLSFAELVGIREQFVFNSSQANAAWHLINAAISNSTSRVVTFPRCPGGSEECGFTSGQAVGWDTVPLWGVDELLDNYKLQFVDVLKVDAEGFDVPAIASGMASLLGRKVGLLSFEYHGIGAWKTHRLEHLVQRLDGLNFVCYFSGKKGPNGSLARLTGCWASKYEFHAWSNVVCVPRDHELYPHVERLTMRYAKYSTLYYSSDVTRPEAAAAETRAAE